MKFKPQFLLIPYVVIEDEELQALDRTLYGVLYYFEGMKDGICFANNSTLAEYCNSKNPGSISNSLTRLEKGGYISREFSNIKGRTKINCLVRFNKPLRLDEMNGGIHGPMNRGTRVGEHIHNIELDECSVANATGGTNVPLGTDDNNGHSPDAKKPDVFDSDKYWQTIIDTPPKNEGQKIAVIVAFYCLMKELKFPSAKACSTEIARWSKEASYLLDFGSDAIQETAYELEEDPYWQDKWTLTTITKQISKPRVKNTY